MRFAERFLDQLLRACLVCNMQRPDVPSGELEQLLAQYVVLNPRAEVSSEWLAQDLEACCQTGRESVS